MTSAVPSALPDLLPGGDHRDAERVLRDAGWVWLGAGDWAITLLSPDDEMVARISPFDPAGPYTAEFYRRAADTRRVPRLHTHQRLAGGGDLMIMERLFPVEAVEAATLHRMIAEDDETVAPLARVLHAVHGRARAELPWCGPIDDNPSNVMRSSDGRLLLIDPFYADGPSLYATARSDPDTVVARIPADDRQFMTEIPLTESGPWHAADREALRVGLAAADARR